LLVLGSRESSFVAVELLFYEAITIARSYGNDPEQNQLLYALKELESGAYNDTKAHFKKSNQRETVIRRFIVQLKNILNSGIKTPLSIQS
ncbi:MAG: hypothetical protein ACXWB9_11535, partial [Flavisolibacter sp.]